jgi:hypothetical protein
MGVVFREEKTLMRAERSEPRRGRRFLRAGAALLLLVSVSCSLLPRKLSPAEKRLAQSGLTIDSLQVEALRFADDYVESVGHAVDVAAKALKTREAEVAALKWKIAQATAAYADATGENPVWNVLDLTILAAVSRLVIEDSKAREEFGDAVVPLINTHRALEASAWSLAGTVLSPEQAEELRNLIVEWRKQNPTERDVAGARFREFAVGLGKGQTPAQRAKPTSVFSMLYLDPFAGLSPTTVAIEQSRELAERVVAYAERAPNLMRWQAELLALQVQQQPAPQQVVSDLGRVSRSIESISQTAEGLPELVDVQRKAAIDQVFAGVSAERQAILAELDARQATIDTLLGQLRETMNAGGAMGQSLTETIKSLDAFVHYVSPPPDPNAPPAKPGKPFDPLEFGKAATDVGGMARDLTTLLRSANETAPALGRIGQQTGEDLKSVIDHAFWRGLVLIVLLLAGSIPARLAYRALERRMARREADPPSRAS